MLAQLDDPVTLLRLADVATREVNPDTSVGAAQQDGTAYSVVQTRSAAANICSGLPDANPDTGAPG
jgi:hypothetical protein